MRLKSHWMIMTVMLATLASSGANADDAANVIALDIEYQSAVERNDAATMARILANDFVLVTGAGQRFSKNDLIAEARGGATRYETQRASRRSVRVWGDTAVVTALLHAKGSEGTKAFEYRVWYSDTYVHFADGWRYVFGQSSLPLPPSKP
jgi:ketosteroid isomerase-like protein